ncbi:MAG: hypothetical protein ACSHYA_17080 [Opitutaceae bacterium]
MKTYDINSVFEKYDSCRSQRISIEGILHFEPEKVAIVHWPKKELKEDQYRSSIWLDSHPNGAFALNEATLSRWEGKRIVVTGYLDMNEIDSQDIGFGHFGLWYARICATNIELLKHWSKNHNLQANEA